MTYVNHAETQNSNCCKSSKFDYKHFGRSNCFDDDLNVFIKLTSSTSIIHDVTFFNDDDQRDE